MGAWICLGFKSLKNYSQNETGSRAQREGSHPQRYYFPALMFREAHFPKKKKKKKKKTS